MQILGPETHPAGSGRPGISSGFFPRHMWLCRGHVTNCFWGPSCHTPWLQGGDHLALWACRPSSLWVRRPRGPGALPYMYSETGALETVWAGGCRPGWLSRLPL